MSELIDLAAERAVLAGLYTYGNDAYVDVSDIITSRTFLLDSNQAIYQCLEHILKDNTKAVVDLASIYSSAQSLGLSPLLDKTEERAHLRAIMNMPVQLGNVRRLAAKVRKLEIGRLLLGQLGQAQNEVKNITGDETVEHILGLAEKPIFDFSCLLADTQGDGPTQMGSGVQAYVEHLIEHPCEMVGISTGFKMYDLAIGGGIRPKTVNLIGARPKVGKAQSLDSIVFTPTGPVRMGDIRVGDKVCHPDGGVSQVLGVYTQGVKPVYEVVFADSDVIRCCKEHLWEVTKRRGRRQKHVLPLEEIATSLKEGDGRNKWSVRLPKVCWYDYRPFQMQPYLLGVLVGDGGLSNSTPVLTNVDEELLADVRSGLAETYELRNTNDGIDYRITAGKNGGRPNRYAQQLNYYGLWGCTAHDKFVPDDYKYNLPEIRLAFLQGLFDTDGSVSKKGNGEFTTASRQLAYDVKEIVQSLGGLCRVKGRYTTCEGKRFFSYRCRISHNDLARFFRMSRKKSRCRVRTKKSLKRTIQEVRYVGNLPTQCIQVSAHDGLYMTDHHVVTHNTQLADNMAIHIARAGVPVLNLDTEMSKEDHWNRMLSNLSNVKVDDIETGRFGKNSMQKQRVLQASTELQAMPYDYLSIAGQPFEETLAVMRRWVLKNVGLGENGKAKPCVIIFDYLKLMSSEALSKNLQEYQLLGFIMTSLHNFMVKYGPGCISFIQLNRDGITREDSDVASGSDRIIWLCSNFTLYKKKSDDEMAEEAGSEVHYNRKLVPIVARHGAGLDDGDYINIQAQYEYGRIVEGPTRNKLNQVKPKTGMLVDVPEDDIPFAEPPPESLLRPSQSRDNNGDGQPSSGRAA